MPRQPVSVLTVPLILSAHNVPSPSTASSIHAPLPQRPDLVAGCLNLESPTLLFFGGEKPTALRTSDDGKHWSELQLSALGTKFSFQHAACADDYLVVSGTDGASTEIFGSDDFGNTWSRIDDNLPAPDALTVEESNSGPPIVSVIVDGVQYQRTLH